MNALIDLLTSDSGWIVYAILFLLIFLENTVPFVPGDAVLAFSSYLVGIGILRPYLTFLLTITAAIAGFIFIYFVAHFWGRTFVDRKKFRVLSPERMAKMDRRVHQHGYWGLAVGRFVPGSRLLMAFMAGFTRLKFLPAILYTSLSIIAWNGLIFILGRLIGENRQAIAGFIAKYNQIASIVVLILLAILIAWYVNHKAKRLERPANG
ncbi:MAG: DedA family protein [Candidatus Marinimicrobia bacterium]|nr:DedA family protein [Candidatus Neomarinimicrobiota bacterium]